MFDSAYRVQMVLHVAGFKSYIVGGAVRDRLMGVEPKDYDIATNARPDDVEAIFKDTIPTGKQYGTITVMMNGFPIEVTTFRKDVSYEDGRRPTAITFADTIEEDLARRDFTINAIAVDLEGRYIDPFDGVEDVKNKILRCVGDPHARFREDRLRILRAFRFYSRGFYMHHTVAVGMRNYATGKALNLSQLSKERVREEFNKILTGRLASKALKLMSDQDILEQIVPDILECYNMEQCNPYHKKDVFGHTLDVIEATAPDLHLRLAAFFHDIGKPRCFTEDENGVGHFLGHENTSGEIAEKVMRDLKYSNDDINQVVLLVYAHMRRLDKPTLSSCKRLVNYFNGDKDHLEKLFQLQIADTVACGGDRYNDLTNIFETRRLCMKIIDDKLPISIKDLDINGHDLLRLGYEGKEIGEQLQLLLQMVIEDASLNDSNYLIEVSKK